MAWGQELFGLVALEADTERLDDTGVVQGVDTGVVQGVDIVAA